MIKIRTDKQANYRGIFFNGKTIRQRLNPHLPITAPNTPEIEDVAINDKCNAGCSYCYTDYLTEYEELKDIREMDNHDIESFLDWHLGAHNRWNSREPQTKPEQYKLLPGCTLEELYDTSKIEWCNSYDVKNNLITLENRDKVIKGIEESVGRFFLYSIDENPRWEMQEQLINIGKRYHLG